MLKLQLPAVTPPGMTAPLGMVAVPRLMVPVMVISADRVVATPSENRSRPATPGCRFSCWSATRRSSAAVRVLVMVFRVGDDDGQRGRAHRGRRSGLEQTTC